MPQHNRSFVRSGSQPAADARRAFQTAGLALRPGLRRDRRFSIAEIGNGDVNKDRHSNVMRRIHEARGDSAVGRSQAPAWEDTSACR